MSISKRLLNVARAELRNAAKKVKGALEGDEDSSNVDPAEPVSPRDQPPPRRTRAQSEAKIDKYYANLELPIGASLAEVKAAYRRMMRRYHPDLHQGDVQKAELATRLAQELRVAYEALIAHLER